MRPVIAWDVDDVLNWTERRGHNPPYCTRGRCTAHAGWVSRKVSPWTGRGARVTLDRANGRRMTAQASAGGELMWFTSWAEDANRCIGPLLGLPDLPVIPFPPWPGDPDDHPGFGEWKGACLARWAAKAGRPVLVYDNDPAIGPALAAAGLAQPWHVVQVNPRTAVTLSDLEEGDAWLASL